MTTSTKTDAIDTGDPDRIREVSGKGWRPDLLGEDGPGARGSRAMFQVLRAYRRPFSATVAAGLAQQGLGIAANTLAAYVVALALTGSSAADLWPWLGVLAVLVLLKSAATWLEAWIGHDLAFRMLAEIRMWLYRAFDRIGPGALLRRRSGDLVARVMSDTEGLEVFYAHTSIYVAVATVLPPAVLVVLALLSPLLALLLVPFLILAATVPLWLRRANARHGKELRESTAAVNTDVVDVITGLREVLAFGQGRARQEQLDAMTDRLGHAERRQGSRGGAEVAASNVIVGVGALVVLVVAARQTLDGELSLLTFAPAVVLAVNAFVPIVYLLNVTRVSGITDASARRVFDLIDEPAAVPDTGTLEVPLGADAAAGLEVRIEQVSFSYGPGLPRALEDVSLTLAPGETVALVGHSGAGKSTLGHLLLRYFDPTDGRILVGGSDLRDLSHAAVTRTIGHVPQDVFLFHDTLAANLRLGAPAATVEEVRAACDAAAVTRFSSALPDGLDTIVGERGARLSGGERQRVAITRALLRDCPVLVLDEAASQLDALSEREVAQALDRVRHDRTTLVIAHRLSTIRRADRVVILEHGRVVGSGTHDELMDEPVYRRLVAGQIDAAGVGPSDVHNPTDSSTEENPA